MSRRGTLMLRREDGRIICEQVKLADTYASRTVGLLGKRTLPPGQGVVLRPSFSIHTFFMRFPIDVIFLDGDLVVIKLSENLPAFRTASCRGSREVVELAAGECARRGLRVGDRVAWASQTGAQAAVGDLVRTPASPDAAPRVLVASDDARFVKLVRFLFDAKGIQTSVVQPGDRLTSTLEGDEPVDAVLLDAGDAVLEALTLANSSRALRPEVPVVIAAEGRTAERAPAGVRVYDKWNETDDLVAAVAEAVKQEQDPDGPSLTVA